MFKRNLVSFIIIGFLGIALFSFIMLFFFTLARNERIDAEIASKYEIINNYAEKTKMPLSKESIALLADEQNRLKSIYARFKLAFTSPLNEDMPDEDTDPLQFKERLIQIQKKLREDANSANLTLPDSLGFTKYETELSEPSEIPNLIKRLKVLDELVYIMTSTGVDSLDELSFAGENAIKSGKKGRTRKDKAKSEKRTALSSLPVPAEKIRGEVDGQENGEAAEKEIYFDIPVFLRIDCTVSELVNFLYSLRLSPFVFIVEDMDIEKINKAGKAEDLAEAKLKASLRVKAIALN